MQSMLESNLIPEANPASGDLSFAAVRLYRRVPRFLGSLLPAAQLQSGSKTQELSCSASATIGRPSMSLPDRTCDFSRTSQSYIGEVAPTVYFDQLSILERHCCHWQCADGWAWGSQPSHTSKSSREGSWSRTSTNSNHPWSRNSGIPGDIITPAVSTTR